MILNVDKKHSKHTKLEKPLGGAFHRNEYGFIGAPCSIIENLVEKIRSSLAHQLSIGWIDAEHQAGEPNTNFITQFTDKIDFISFETKHSIGEKQYHKWFQHLDLLFVNGNHFLADKQVVIINEKKKDSLERKLDRLSRPLLFILDTGMEEIHDFLKGRWDIPVYSIDQIEAIAQYILKDWKATLPPLHGLVLAGGKSQRMGGVDKGSIRYHGVEQREFVASMLKKYCAETFLSIRGEQVKQISTNFGKIQDTFMGLGPYGGILSAFRRFPNSAWLTVACDLPYLSQSSIEYLVSNRDRRKLATCFHNPATEFPEPLITIWEPRAYPVMLEFLSMGYSCPRKVLINSEVHQLELKDIDEIKNVNTPEERDAAIEKL